jgi:ABC-type sulfate/molybdate transport systems ATPase subunit
MLTADVRSRRGEFALELSLAAEPRSTLVLVGENGSGKTTFLRLLAGLDRPEGGRIALGDRVWFDAASGAFVAPEHRAIGYVPQDLALFPHLTVRENVGFGLRASKRPDAEVRERVDALLARFGITALADRKPGTISGGERQRVALGRALALEPDLLLLDEPFASLDLPTRRGMRGEMRRLLSGLPCVTVFVTHDPMEALAFGDQIAVLEDGRATQVGDRDDLLRHPRSAYVAEFLGLNRFVGRVISRGGGVARVACEGGTLSVVDPGEGDDVLVVVAPREIVLSREKPAGSALNVFEGLVDELTPEPPAGERLRVRIASQPPLVAEVTRASAESMGLAMGVAVFASFKATGATVFR